MRRQLAITAAKWLAKRENREKVKRAARQFKARMEQDERGNNTRASDTGTGRRPGHGRKPHDEKRPGPGDRD